MLFISLFIGFYSCITPNKIRFRVPHFAWLIYLFTALILQLTTYRSLNSNLNWYFRNLYEKYIIHMFIIHCIELGFYVVKISLITFICFNSVLALSFSFFFSQFEFVQNKYLKALKISSTETEKNTDVKSISLHKLHHW